MRFLSLVFGAVLLASTSALPRRRSLGIPIPIQKRSTLVRDGIVDLDALRSHVTYSEGKYLRGVAAMQRVQGVPMSPPSGDSLNQRGVGVDPLTPSGTQLWYGTISVGSPAVEYKVDFDTGSADLFLPASNCDSTCDQHTRYNPNASSSAINLYKSFTLAYGDGSTASGEQYSDAVTIAGLVAKNQTVGAASQYSTGFQIAKFVPDGLLGMAFAHISRFQGSTVVESLVAQGQLSDPVFAFKLASSGSELRLGGVDNSLYTGSLTYAPVTEQGFWQISVDSINANDKAVSKGLSAIVDTGTTFILGNTKNVGQFYSAVNATYVGGGFYTMPCNAMPNVSITIQGKPFTISSDIFNLGSYNTSGSGCVGAIVATGSLGNMWILGDVFLRNVYSVFDIGGLQADSGSLAGTILDAVTDPWTPYTILIGLPTNIIIFS